MIMGYLNGIVCAINIILWLQFMTSEFLIFALITGGCTYLCDLQLKNVSR